MGHRNRILYLLEIYELLLEGKQTFHSLRQSIGIGYNPLKEIISKLLEEEYIFKRVLDGTRYYEITPKLIEIFNGRMYDSIKELREI